MVDPVVNKGQVTVSIGYDASAVSIVLASGDGTKLPDPVVDGSYNLSWWDSSKYANPVKDPNFEIVRVTGPAGTGDTKTITRAQENTAASAKNTAGSTYEMILGITAKMITDLDTEKSLIANITDMEDQSFINLLQNGDFESWSAGVNAAPDGWTYSQNGAGGGVARAADTKIANYVSRITKSDTGNSLISQHLTNYNRYKSRVVSVCAWVKSTNSVSDQVMLYIGDGIGSSAEYYQNSGNWELLQITHTVDASATQVKPSLIVDVNANATADFVGIIFTEGSVCPVFSSKSLVDDGKTIQIDSDNNIAIIDTLETDTINEDTLNAGVTIDTVLIKDGNVDGIDVSVHDPATTGVHGVGANTILHSGNKDVASGIAGLNGSIKQTVSQHILNGIAPEGTQVFNATITAIDTFQDLDLSAVVGSRYALVICSVGVSTGIAHIEMRQNGSTRASLAGDQGNVSSSRLSNPDYANIICVTDSVGKVEIACDTTAPTITINIIGWIGLS